MHALRVPIACAALAVFVLRPRGHFGNAALAVGAAAELALGVPLGPAPRVVLPLAAFVAAAVTLAAIVERSGLALRAASALARAARGRVLALYALTCALCAVLTSVVSLDGAVVLMVPVLLALGRRWSAPFAPFFVGTVVVANVVSVALPQGNPTNLVVMERLGIGPQAFAVHMAVPGVVAACLTAMLVAIVERRALSGVYARCSPPPRKLSADERRAALALAVGAAATWGAPLVGVAPWWPFTAGVALAALMLGHVPRVGIALRVGAQVAALVVISEALEHGLSIAGGHGATGLLGVAAAVGGAAAVANNLPVSVAVAGTLGGPAAYAGLIGLAAGALALPRGSVATIIAIEAAGADAPRLGARRLVPLAAAAVATATLLVWAGL